MGLRTFGRKLSRFEQFLFLILFFIVIIIISGTILAFALRKASPGAGMKKLDQTTVKVEPSENSTGVYVGIGELRALTADNPPRTLVINPYFSYKDNDSALHEELVQKNKKMRALILGYIISQSYSELISQGELAVKAELFKLINDELVIGKIEEIYFTEYIFF